MPPPHHRGERSQDQVPQRPRHPARRTSVVTGLVMVAAVLQSPQLSGQAVPTRPSAPSSAQEPANVFADAWTKERVTPLIIAREHWIARESSAAIRIFHRARVGILIRNQWLWRDRSLFSKESVVDAWLRGAGRDSVVYRARARRAPLLGVRNLSDRESAGLSVDPESDQKPLLGIINLGTKRWVPDLPEMMAQEGMNVFGTRLRDPLDTPGFEEYRFSPGPRFTVDLPVRKTIETVFVESEGQQATDLVGALFFDAEDARLIRALYRPRGEWTLDAGLAGWLARIPIIGRRGEARLRYVLLEYDREGALASLPTRMQAEGTVSWAYGLLQLPTTNQWWGEPDPPDAPSDSSSVLPPPLTTGWGFRTPLNELNPYLRVLDQVTDRPKPPGALDVIGSSFASIRHNRVQGLSMKIRYPYPIGHNSTVEGSVRLTATGEPASWGAAVDYQFRPLSYSGRVYRELADVSRWEEAGGVWNSFTSLFFGEDNGDYYRATGGRAGVRWVAPGLRVRGEAYVEDHEDAPERTDFSIFDRGSGSTRPNIEAEEGRLYGLDLSADLQSGDDPNLGVFIIRGWVEGAVGDFDFVTGGVTADLLLPRWKNLAFGTRLSAGTTGGRPPIQKHYFLGGAKTLRGFQGNSVNGETYWLARPELAYVLPASRIVVFSDMGWAAASPDEILSNDPLISLGAGVSFLDGIFRIDVARGVKGGEDWHLYIQSSALF